MNKLKYVVCMASMLPAFAHAAFTMPHGFYLGGSASVVNTSFSNNITFDPTEVENAPLYARNQRESTAQVQPGFLLGYEFFLNDRWLLSAEFQASFFKSYANASGSDYNNNELTTNNQFAFQVRGGTKLGPDEDYVYALLGWARSQTDVNIIFDNTNLTVGALGDLQLGTVKLTRTLSGVKVGVGYEKHLNHDLGLRFDYSHTQYGSFNIFLNDPAFAGIFAAPLGTSTIRENNDMLGITLMLLS